VRGEMFLLNNYDATFTKLILICQIKTSTTNLLDFLDFEKSRVKLLKSQRNYQYICPVFITKAITWCVLVIIPISIMLPPLILSEENCPLYPENMVDPLTFLFSRSAWDGPVTGE
jgi:hypothetical protein